MKETWMRYFYHSFYFIYHRLRWLIASSYYAFFFCNGLMAPNWRISATSSLSWGAPLVIFAQWQWMETCIDLLFLSFICKFCSNVCNIWKETWLVCSCEALCCLRKHYLKITYMFLLYIFIYYICTHTPWLCKTLVFPLALCCRA